MVYIQQHRSRIVAQNISWRRRLYALRLTDREATPAWHERSIFESSTAGETGILKEKHLRANVGTRQQIGGRREVA